MESTSQGGMGQQGYDGLPQPIQSQIIGHVVQPNEPQSYRYPKLGNPLRYFCRSHVERALGSMSWLEFRIDYNGTSWAVNALNIAKYSVV